MLEWKRVAAALGAALVGISGVAVGCSGAEDSEVRANRQHLTEFQSRVLGFELPTADWAVTNGSTLAESTNVSQGSASLAIQPNGYTEINSTAIDAPGAPRAEATFEVIVPSVLPWGDARLIAKVPSEGHYWTDLGGRPLAGLTAGEYHTLSFVLPSDIQEALESEATDVSFTIVLNVGSGWGEFLVDNLVVSEIGGEEPVEGGTETFVFSIPSGHTVDEVLISGSERVTVDDRSALGTEGLGTVVFSGGPQRTEFGAGVDVHGDVLSQGDIDFLRSGAHIFGDVRTAGSLLQQDNVVIDGQAAQGVSVGATDASWSVIWPSPERGDVSLPPDAPNEEIAAGSYDSIQVFSRATFTFRSGTYFINSFVVEPEAHFRVDTSNGPVIVYTRDVLRLNTGIEYLGGPDGAVLFAHRGDQIPLFQEAIDATVIAPWSTIELRRPNSGEPHRGAFFGKGVQVFSDATVEHRAFSFSTLCPSGVFRGSGCVGEAGSPTRYVAGEIQFPRGVNPDEVVLAARDGAEIGSSSSLSDPNRILTVAQGQATVGSNSTAPGITAVEGAIVAAGATVEGDILSNSPSSVDEEAVVAGTIQSSAGLTPIDSYPVSIAFPPSSSGDLKIVAGRSKIIFPGYYGTVEVEDGATAYVQSGRYSFEALVLRPGSQLLVAARDGWVQLQVGERLVLGGVVSALGSDEVELSIIYGGVTPLQVKGSFRGGLIAPNAGIEVSEGPHVGTLYGTSVSVADGVQMTGGISPWHLFVSKPRVPDVVVDPPANLPGSLVATTEEDGSMNDVDGIDLLIPSRIPVTHGNAGNAQATLTITTSTGVEVCTFRGGASTPQPTDILEKARGQEYLFEQCTGDSQPGDKVVATSIDLSVDGDPDAPNGTGVSLPAGRGCGGVFPAAISAAKSREMIDSFEWPEVPPPPFLSADSVPERTADGLPSLFYVNIYVTSVDELSMLDELMIHWMRDPLFEEEWPLEWDAQCGAIHYPADGEGVWVYALIPGAMYNAFLQARNHPQISEDQREVFRAIRLIDPPAHVSTSIESVDLTVLGESGFRYLGLDELPNDDALAELLPWLYPKGAVSAVIDVAKFIGGAARGLMREMVAFVGTIGELVNGRLSVDLDFNIKNQDERFQRYLPDSDFPGEFLRPAPFQTAWGARAGREVAPDNARVIFYEKSAGIVGSHRGKLGLDGKVRLTVARGGKFKRVCIDLENHAGFMSHFLMAGKVCVKDIEELDDLDAAVAYAKLTLDNWELYAMTEVTDSWMYLHEIGGTYATKAKILHGSSATRVSGLGKQRMWAPCFGLGSVTADTGLGITALAGLALPAVDPTDLVALWSSDIVIPGVNERKGARGMMTHEYGHYAMCTLADFAGQTNWANTVVLHVDILLEGNDIDVDDETRLINETFADFFSAQVSNTTNYVQFVSISGTTTFGTYRNVAEDATEVSIGIPGFDRNVYPDTPPALGTGRGHVKIASYVTLMQDMFDGREHRLNRPGSGESWVLVEDSDGEFRIAYRGDAPNAPFAHRTGDDKDDEILSLGGASLRSLVDEFYEAQGPTGHSYDAFEIGLANATLKSANWCEACLAFAPHFEPPPGDLRPRADANESGDNLRKRIEQCQSGRLSELLGEPPSGVLGRNAFTCEPCPPGEGMLADGTCGLCDVDVVHRWNTPDPDDTAQTCDAIEYGAEDVAWSADDICPDTLVVQVLDVQGAVPMNLVAVDLEEGHSAACMASTLSASLRTTTGTGGPGFSVAIGGTYTCEEGEENICPDPCAYDHPDFESGTNGELLFPVAVHNEIVTSVSGGGQLDPQVILRNEHPSCPVVTK